MIGGCAAPPSTEPSNESGPVHDEPGRIRLAEAAPQKISASSISWT
jgi:hypothetical protein